MIIHLIIYAYENKNDLSQFGFTTGENDPFIKSPTVAKLTNTPNGPLISCDLKALKDTVNFPLSQLTEELQIVKLDNRDEALIGGWIRTTVGEKYILVSNNKQTPIDKARMNI